VKTKFGLKECRDKSFFLEWQENLPTLTVEERQALDQIKANFLYLSEWSVAEEVVKLVVLSRKYRSVEAPIFQVGEETRLQRL
jgi:hypothetical protein